MTNHQSYSEVIRQLFPATELVATQRLTGGVSAEVQRLDLRGAEGSTFSVVLRAHRGSHARHPAALEYRLLQVLHRSGVPVPEPLLVDASGTVLADPFVVMEFVDGTIDIPATQQDACIDAMAEALAEIHELSTTDLPSLPARANPLPEVFEFLPAAPEWNELSAHLHAVEGSGYTGIPALLHGDFWPGNLLWRDGALAAILDWEDAAIGDPLSDVACCRLELRYKFGTAGMQRFTEAYARQRDVDPDRLALWQVYVAAAAQRYMGQFGLEPALEAHMRTEALASIREAGDALMDRGPGPIG